MQEVKFLVPDDKVPEIYQLVGDWMVNGMGHEASFHVIRASNTELGEWSDSDQDLAAEVWARMTDAAKSMFRRLMRAPGHAVPAGELATEAGFSSGVYGVAGGMAWPSEFCRQANRRFPIGFQEGEEGTRYWINEVAARLFREADDFDVAS